MCTEGGWVAVQGGGTLGGHSHGHLTWDSWEEVFSLDIGSRPPGTGWLPILPDLLACWPALGAKVRSCCQAGP